MKRIVGTFAVVVGLVFAGQLASAQESTAGGGRAEVSAFPGGGILFTESSGTPEFGNYALGGSFTFNFNRFVGVEGEGGGSFGIDQRLDLRSGTRSVRPPNTLAYSGNAIVYPAGNNRAFVPYATGASSTTSTTDGASAAIIDSSPSVPGMTPRPSLVWRLGTVTESTEDSSSTSCRSQCAAHRIGSLLDFGIRSRRRPDCG